MSEILLNMHEDGLAELVLNRAPVNALSAPFLTEFAATIAKLERDDSVRAIFLTSPFKVLSAGLDLKEAQHFDIPQQHAILRGLNEGFLTLFACPKPTVCAVNGAAIAGGLFFVLGSDLRVASSRARFGLAEVRVGADFPVGPMEIARATLSPDMLRRLMLTGQPIDAHTAHAAGIVDVLDDDVHTRALAEARALAQIPPVTFAKVKQQIRGATIALIEKETVAGGNAPEGGWFNAETRGAMQAMIG
ncbi:enoyl-CoA hydratase/isomerase family protein [Ruegeria sp. WL0004]|uniref:Enoyl-CoA hydratase/isomerase family protein n=1 Tax=Ruegeria marisflavi TaxID=2984152 RepID=A0ABT2WQ38_9RHOB|nr:enoyl-CoA hydratase/isomerase family protein [Ruegeria sp. WL0004]MCU9837100.1 enoyl-CoA hydratase/isomerase family protein [Ruegeria sp. WL0004]